MESSPTFLFPGRAEPSAQRLTAPDHWMVGPTVSGQYQTHGFDSFRSDDPYEAIDRFFERFDRGVVAGWLSYELAAWNHGLAKPDHSPDRLPLLCLAHYSGWDAGGATDSSTVELGQFEPDRTRDQYESGVREIKDAIRRGDVYQVNLSQRFTTRVRGSLQNLLKQTKESERPPHTVYGSLGGREILSLSPERFLRVDGKQVMTEPIKGTRPRGATPHEDDRLREELLRSEKDRAEHAMIVDLERNDLNRVCDPGTVRTSELAGHRCFPTVHHLVSTVKGRLRSGMTPGELFRRTFPGGSITGAPKHTAVRLIDRLETRQRGIYTGTIGYWDLDHDLADWNIAIRTLVREKNKAWWDSGGGIVIDSDPADEFSESLDKVALIRRLGRSTDQSAVDQLRSGGGRRGTGGLV